MQWVEAGNQCVCGWPEIKAHTQRRLSLSRLPSGIVDRVGRENHFGWPQMQLNHAYFYDTSSKSSTPEDAAKKFSKIIIQVRGPKRRFLNLGTREVRFGSFVCHRILHVLFCSSPLHYIQKPTLYRSYYEWSGWKGDIKNNIEFCEVSLKRQYHYKWQLLILTAYSTNSTRKTRSILACVRLLHL